METGEGVLIWELSGKVKEGDWKSGKLLLETAIVGRLSWDREWVKDNSCSSSTR